MICLKITIIIGSLRISFRGVAVIPSSILGGNISLITFLKFGVWYLNVIDNDLNV